VRESPDEIKPWYGPTRGFSFKRDVQPVLDQYCAGCHNGARKDIPDLAAKPKNGPGNFTPSYLALHPYVRRPGPESDYHMFAPLEFHPSTSELIQMLRKGHHNVKLDAEAYDRLYTWIDQNVPDHGTWNEHRAVPGNFHQRRLEMRTKYANRPEDPDAIPNLPQKDVKLVQPEPVEPVKPDGLECPGWPFDAAEAQRRQAAAGTQTRRTVELGDGVKMEFVLVPAGDFPMGDLNGFPDERPRTRVKIARPFWMGVTEVTNRQYRPFDPDHDSRFVDQQHKDHTTPGYAANLPEQPVIRISWKEALAFCEWLKQKTGEPFTLPSEAEWEWACRAGSGRPCSYGGLDDDFSPYANLADASIRLLAVDGINPQPVAKPNQFQDFTPKDARFDDKEKVVANAGKYKPNAWGLQDMHGNVWEWTRSAYRPYPYRDDDGRNDLSLSGEKVVRGGSWYDRPARARSSFRLAYRFYQPAFNVGFRVVCPVGQNGQK
jgi:formylglycine-generating enzyme required for sulfatase activity